MTKVNPNIAALRDRDAIDHDGFEAWLADMGWAWQPLSRGEYGLTLEEAQLAYVCQDPVRWSLAFLDEPDTGEPYRFFPYQEESIRSWRQDVIHQDGAEVGKTREITALILWGMCTGFGGEVGRPWCLVGAPQQTHLDEIILAIEEHMGVDEGAIGKRRPFLHHFWRRPKRTPHTMFRFATPAVDGSGRQHLGRVYFRPAGHDGEAFRGVHVNALACFDEAAKAKGSVIWSEFHRALKPGCRRRIYSVPDGDNATEFYRMTQQAVPDLSPRKDGLRLFHWAKTLMPEPFWSQERRREFITRYGGEDTPGYQRNVLGLHGQQENPVWSWDVVEPCVQEVPEYRCLKLLADAQRAELHVVASRIALQVSGEGKKSGQERFLADRYEDLSDFREKDRGKVRVAVRALLRAFLTPPGQGVFWFGADLGFSNDPTELMVFRELGAELRLVARLHAKGVSYDLQCALIDGLDELFGRQGAWGVDFGSAGTAVVQMLQALEEFQAGDFEERMTGFQFASALDAIDEDGNVLEEVDTRSDKIARVRLPAKELATNLITARFQRLGMVLPYDPEVVQHITNHTAREGARHRIFAKENDHTIDAIRAAMLRKVFDEQAGGVDVFSSGVYERRSA